MYIKKKNLPISHEKSIIVRKKKKNNLDKEHTFANMKKVKSYGRRERASSSNVVVTVYTSAQSDI